MKNRILALTLSLSLALAAPATAADSGFADVPAGSWYEAAVELCVEKGIMVGTAEDTFAPEATLTRAECATLALRLYDLRRGGDGSFEKAPEDWGKLTLTLADGTELTSFGYAAAPLPGLENTEFSFSWRAYRHNEYGYLCADLTVAPELMAEDYELWSQKQDLAKEWGEAHEGTATVTVGDMTIPGTVDCWLPLGNWMLAFHPDNDGDHTNSDAIWQTVQSGALAPDVWYRDAAYYAVNNKVNIGFAAPEEPATRAVFATWLALAAGRMLEVRQVDFIPGVNTTEWYAKDAYALYRAGVLTGKDEYGSFDPEGTLTRAEAATMVARVLDDSLRVSAPLAPLPAGAK